MEDSSNGMRIWAISSSKIFFVQIVFVFKLKIKKTSIIFVTASGEETNRLLEAFFVF